MGAEISTASHNYAESRNTNNNDTNVNLNVNQKLNRPSMKPNKVKKNNYFHSKPSKLVDLIVNKDWQSVLNRCKSHPKEIYVTQKVRLYGVDRKILPLHIACAMRPPEEILSVLLTPDQVNGMSTVKTPMINVKKKTMRKKMKNVEIAPMTSYPQQLILGISASASAASASASDKEASDKDSKEYDHSSPRDMCRTAPLSPSDIQQTILVNSSSQDDDGYGENFFFPDAAGGVGDKENNQQYALQITPSGEVKQISPNGKSHKSRTGTGTGTTASESPFVHASAHAHAHAHSSSDDQPSFQSAMADDFLPIHIACLFRSSPDVIKLLIRCHPEGLQEKNKWGMLPIHIVCSNLSLDPPSIMAGKLVDNFTTKDFLNNLYSESIDTAEQWDMVKVIEMLVASYPQCVNTPSDNIEWYTPLEYASRNLPRGDEREEILRVLRRKKENSCSGISISCDSISSSLSDSKASSDIKVFPISNCPLLYSYISTKQWDRSIDWVTKKTEEASFWVVDTDYPRLPIHLACSHSDVPQDLIEALLNAYPEGCTAKEGSGSNPLHLACKNCLPLDIIATLLTKYPKATRVKDQIGRLPLHLACASGTELSVVKILMDAYPASCSMKDYNGHTALTYVDYCIEGDTVKDEFSALFEKYEDETMTTSPGEDQGQKIIEEEGDYLQLEID